MKAQHKFVAIFVLIFSLFLSGCGSGQLFGPTITPSSTMTNTPPPTPTLTSTNTSTPTATPFPIKVVKIQRAVSIPIKNFTFDGINFTPSGAVYTKAKGAEMLVLQIETNEEINPGTDLILVDEAGNKYFSEGLFTKNKEYAFEVPKAAQNLNLVIKNKVRVSLILDGTPTPSFPTVTSTPLAIQASNNPSDGPILGSIDETKKAQAEKVKPLEQVAQEQYLGEMPVGGSRQYTIHVANSNTRLIWYQGWCDNNLTQNLKNMKFDLQVNGQTIDLDKKAASNYFDGSNGQSCIVYSIVMENWPSGSTSITSKTIFLNPINDGITDYNTGEQTRVFTVINP
jgi:hypothetical protein